MNKSSASSKKKRIPLWAKILIGMALGILNGIFFKSFAIHLKPFGDIFIRAINMLIVLLIFSSLMTGITSISDMKKMGRIGIKTFVLYIFTTGFAVVVGLFLCNLLKPGVGLDITQAAKSTIKVSESPSLTELFVQLIPKNPIKAFATGNVLQIIIFTLIFGIAVNLAGEKAAIIKKGCSALAEAMYKMTHIVMACTPYGVFALIGNVVAQHGMEMLQQLAQLVGTVYLGCGINMVLLGLLVLIFARLNPIHYFRGVIDAFLFAFSTSSSSATLPVSMRCAEDSLGISPNVASFSLPLGATINMDGTALYQGICAVFLAQIYGIELELPQYAMIVATSCLGAIGTAGIPSAGLITLAMVLKAGGIPLEGIAFIAGVDRLLDMARTSVNVSGDLAVSIVVAKSENELDIETYNKTPEPEEI